MLRNLLIIVALLISTCVHGQLIEARSNSLAGSNNQLPFWLWANQLGRYERTNNFIQHFGFNGQYQSNIKESDFAYEMGSNLDVLLGKNSSIRFTELYGALDWKILVLKGGAFSENEKYNGLSASNGNLAATRNARPHPKLRLGFNRFVPVFVKWFSIYGFYEEGFFNDNRYVEETHLHRKAFYFRFGKENNFSFTGGLEHFVMWGGTHPIDGELPGWESYFDYIFSRSGGSNALPTDQANIMGNQFGTYQVEISKEWNRFNGKLYISHPYDDRSGLELKNYQDNLYGIFIELKDRHPLIKGILLEYYYTKNQSGPFHLVPQRDGTSSGRGRDNYFNHGVYRSGVSYEQIGMVSPFFSPVIIRDDVSMGFENTRFSGFHAGSNGYLSESWSWKAMISYIHHFGQYDKNGEDSFQPTKKQLSTLLNISWNLNKKPLSAGISLAADRNTLFEEANTFGVQLHLCWKILSTQ